jgi:hypothetical protein
MNDWQTWAALSVVAVTAGIFAWRAVAKRKKDGCGGGCGCAHTTKPRQQ